MARFPLDELRRIVRLHTNWLKLSLLGKDVLSTDEYEELRRYGKLPLQSLDLVESSFLLGRLKAVLRSQDYKDITYESLKDQQAHATFSDVERLAIEHAKLVGANNLKGIEDDIVNGVYSRFATVSGQQLTAETVRTAVRDEVVAALEERKTAQQLASALASTLATENKRDWLKVAKTELHRSKMMGVAQAISNKYGPYAGGDGPDSNVVVIPSRNACEDCLAQYLDGNGNPRVFKLSDLIAAGSNGDPGTSHKRGAGIHIHWKATLPPLHPNCGCVVQYLPPGAGFVAGKMVVKSVGLYEEAIRKATDGVGSPTVKPPGPASATKNAPAPASLPGAKSPSQSAPAGTVAAKKGAGGGGGGRANGGQTVRYVPKGSVAKRPTGTIRETDSSYVVVPGMSSGKPPTEEQKEIIAQEAKTEADKWSKKVKDHKVKLNHYAKGEIAYSKPLGEAAKEDKTISMGGMDKSKLKRVIMKGNGPALQKPPHDWSFYGYGGSKMDNSEAMRSMAIATGYGSCPHQDGHKREVGSYKIHSLLGMSGHVPPATIRHEADGTASSMSEWLVDYTPLSDGVREQRKQTPGGPRNFAAATLHFCPPEKRDELRQKMEDHAVMAIVLNNNDANLYNHMVANDFTDVQAIDQTFTGSTSLVGHNGSLHGEMHRNGMKVRISDKMNERFNKTTLHDMMRANEGHYQDWQVGQSYLRMRYAQAIQEKHGHLDHSYFKATIADGNGKQMPLGPEAWKGMKGEHGKEDFDPGEEWKAREANETLPSQMFDSWAKNYLNTASSDPNHPDHVSAKALVEMNPFMPAGHEAMKDPAEFRRQGKHIEHSNSIVPRDLPTSPDAGYPRDTEQMDTSGLLETKRPGGGSAKKVDELDDPFASKKPADSYQTAPDAPDAPDDDFSEFDEEDPKGSTPPSDRPKTKRPLGRMNKGLWLSPQSMHRRLDTVRKGN